MKTYQTPDYASRYAGDPVGVANEWSADMAALESLGFPTFQARAIANVAGKLENIEHLQIDDRFWGVRASGKDSTIRLK